MRILLIGPPNSQKRKWAKKFQERDSKLQISAQPKFMLAKQGVTPALGILSDYRTELFLASTRAMQMMMTDDMIFVHSPIDSYAHVVARLQQKQDVGLDDENWLLTLLGCGMILNNSVKFDEVWYVAKHSYASDFERLVDVALAQILSEFNITSPPVEDAFVNN